MKYECSYCGDSLKPCVVGHDDRRPVELLGICPFRRYAKPRWKQVSDKPDPHVVTSADEGSAGEPQADGDIMKVGKDWWGCRNSEDSLYAFEDFVRLIEAKIKAMRKLFRNHGGRIKELDTSTVEKTSLVDLVHISSKETLEAACKIETLGRKVEQLEKETKAHVREDFDFRRTEFEIIRRKVEQTGGIEDRLRGLQSRVYRLEGHGKDQPQPKGGVATDKNGHDLIPGVSVYELPEGGCERIFHHQVNNTTFGYQCLGSAKVADWLAPDRTEAVTWLRDLDFPPFAKAQDVGGDK